ncbi:hypothetical protein WA026_023487 [Henosepilachna vigintioctopunctata]|uniref:Uncharacterized protein n=1 Tax=Henosepilachna vigintioctopunctata TaxID=420089 RepID=A0AAW1V3A1_9CUCU
MTISETNGENVWQTVRKSWWRGSALPILVTFKNTEISFKGKERKAWFFINRIKTNVSGDIAEKYIRSKSGLDNETIEVQELQFERKRGNLKSYLVKVPFPRKDKIYKPEFWPENVGIKRFNPQAYKKNSMSGTFVGVTKK